MKIRYSLDIIAPTRARESQTQEWDQQSIILGRGGKSDIILPSNLLAIEHVKISLSTNSTLRESVLLEVLEGAAPITINSKRVTIAELNDADQIELANFKLRVERTNKYLTLNEERVIEAQSESLEKKSKKLETRLSLANCLPSAWRISLFISLCLLVMFFIIPTFSTHKSILSSGKLTNQHRMLEKQCSVCHTQAFNRVSDQACLACHNMSEHSNTFSRLHIAQKECAFCHREHNGQHNMTVTSSNLCADCHGNIKKLAPDSILPNVTAFNQHPQFRVRVLSFDAITDKPRIEKVSLDHKEQISDNSRIKLNHKIHLQEGIRGPDGPVTLECKDCHEASSDQTKILAISHDKHCASCHTREFDPRLPGNQVPHAEPDVVYNFIYAEYAKLFLADPAQQASSNQIERFRPGRDLTLVPERSALKSDIEKESRLAEEELFTRTACQLCHEVKPKPVSQEALAVGTESRYKILKPYIYKRWFPAANFDHGSHTEIVCASCHVGIRISTRTEDVLIPIIEQCQACHRSGDEPGFASSECIMCHSYHDPNELADEKKQSIERIVNRALLK